jgi:hypothetical protein
MITKFLPKFLVLSLITVYFCEKHLELVFACGLICNRHRCAAVLLPQQSREVVPAVTGKSIIFKLKIYTHEKTETRLRRGIATKNDSR